MKNDRSNILIKILKKTAAVIIYILVIFIITSVVLEIFFRIVRPYNLGLADGSITLVRDKKFKVKNFNRHLDDYIMFSKNSIGFRGAEPPADFDKYLTIVANGGSTTENARLTDDKEWVSVLGKLISKDYNNVWVNNAGFAGQSTKAQLIIVKDHILKLKPKICLILTGINDLGNVERDRYIENIHVPPFLVRVSDFLKTRSYFYSFIYYLKEQIICRIVGLGYRLEFDLEKIKPLAINKSEADNIKKIHMDRMGTFSGNLETIVSMLKQNNITPVIISQTTLCGNAVEEKTKVDLSRIQVGLLNGGLYSEILGFYNQTARGIAEKNKLLFIDLDKKLDKKYEYYFDYIHYTNSGSQKVAEIIYNDIQPFLKSGYKKFKK